ncbi:MAG: Rid family detoxifying hydrolase [Candidatus Bathyarchaeia archaeon]
MVEIIRTENAPKPIGPYSQAVKAGKFLFVSGQVAIDPKEGKIIAKTVREQTARAIENIRAILQAAGYELNDVIQSTVYLASMDLFSEFNIEYAKYFSKDFPARATAGVKLMSNALVEISVVAYRE